MQTCNTDERTNEEKSLSYYLQHYPESGACGITAIQRACKVSYGEAVTIEKLGIETGVLKRDSDTEWLHTKA
jgi:hypothetical protein